MAEEQIPAPKTPKSEWVKPMVALVEAGEAEANIGGRGADGYYQYS